MAAPAADEPAGAAYTEEQLGRMTKAQLLELCDELGVEASSSMVKADIIAAIVNR